MKLIGNMFGTALALLLFEGCQKSIPLHGLWHGSMILSNKKDLPFDMVLNLDPKNPSGYFLNGEERTEIPEIDFRHDTLFCIFSEYQATMFGVWNGTELKGKFYRYRDDTTSNEFTISPQESKIITSDSTIRYISLAGRYQAYFSDRKKVDSTLTANFWIKNDSIYGTFIAPDGDYGLLVGKQQGNVVRLYRFTGWQAFAVVIEYEGSSWQGKIFSRSGEPQSLRLKPFINHAQMTRSKIVTSMKNSKSTFSFFGTTSTGDTLYSTDERFTGKVLVVDIMGTWCHNCMDAAPLLQKLYEDFHKDGVEIVGLSFEITDNASLAQKNLDLYQKRYSLTYPVIFCGSTQNTNVDMRLRCQLVNFEGYPTTLFIDRKGYVTEIHVGFNGPGTGNDYQLQVQEYYRAIKTLLK